MEVSSAKKKSSSISSQDGQANRGQNIQVFVRVRPLNSSEKSQRSCSIVDTQGNREVVIKDKPTTLSATTKTFGFDRVFGPMSKQAEVHKAVVGPLIKQVLQGYNCTVFAYGQTGTGKTYTMEGLGEIRGAWDNDPNAGIIPRALSDLFDGLRMTDAVEYSVRVSFLELYNEEIFDLLSGTDDQSKLRLYEDGQKRGSVIIQGLEDVQVHDKREVFKILERGSIKRQTAETKMNATSSRSHTIFTVTVYINQQSLEGEDMLRIGKLNLVDLAGSENIGRSGAINQRAREAGNINQSLLTLGRVITSLVDRTPHIPYRESKLTRLLQDSLGGRTKTSIIATISPASINHEETLSTLDYAHRAKNITNKPEVNQKISKKEKLLEYHHEIDKLKQELLAAREKDGVFLPKATYEEQVKTKQRQEEEIVALTKELKAKETEMENFLEMFNETKAKLESTTEERDKTIRALDCTRIVLHKTEHDKKQEEYLKLKHHETEKKLSQQAKTLLEISEQSTEDLSKVHDKIERQRAIQDHNDKLKTKLGSAVGEHHKCFGNSIKDTVKNQVSKIKQVDVTINNNAKLRQEAVSNLSSDYKTTLLHLFETLQHIKGLATNNKDAESTWISEILSLADSEKEMRSDDFQHFLADTLQRSADDILSVVSKQNDKIVELSTKIDVDLKQMENKLNAFMENRKIESMAHQSKIDTLFEEMERLNEIKRQNIVLESKAEDAHMAKQNDCIKQIKALLDEHDKCAEIYEKERQDLLKSKNKAVEEQSALFTKAQDIRSEEGKKADLLNKKYQDDNLIQIQEFRENCSKSFENINDRNQVIVDSTKQLKSDSEVFILGAKNDWEKYSNDLVRMSSSRRENSVKYFNDIDEKHKEMEGTITISEKKNDATVLQQKETENSTLLSLQSMLSQINEDHRAFEEKSLKEIDNFKAFANNFISDMKKDIPVGTTPQRVERKFPRKIIEGTPDEARIKDFKSSIDASGTKLAKILDMEAVEGEDSVFSSPAIPSEYGGTSSVDYQETGYGSDEDKFSIKSDKENCNPNPKEKNRRGRDFVKPKVSKLKQANNTDSQPNSHKGSRNGSRTRQEIKS